VRTWDERYVALGIVRRERADRAKRSSRSSASRDSFAARSDHPLDRRGVIARRRLRSSLTRGDYRRDHVSGEPGGVLGAACSDRDESIVRKRSAAPVRGKATLPNIHRRASAAGPQHKRGRAAVVVTSVPDQACDRCGIAPFTQASGRGFETRFSPNAGPARQGARTPGCLCRVASAARPPRPGWPDSKLWPPAFGMSPYVRRHFRCKRRQGTAPETVWLTRYVRALVDVNDVNDVSPAAAGSAWVTCAVPTRSPQLA
jgi:hypothetical protein